MNCTGEKRCSDQEYLIDGCQLVMGPLVEALRGLRGIDLISAATFIASTGDLSRFESPRLLMGYLGLVPSEHSSGGMIRRGGITKTGNREARRMLIEAAWSYQYPARIAKTRRRSWSACPRTSATSLGRHKPGSVSVTAP